MTTPNFFKEDSPFLRHPLLTPERTAKEIDFVIEQAQIEPGASVLDVGCGFGRHSVELAKRGFEVLGIDPSQAMIAEATRRANEAGVPVDFLQAKAQDFVTEKTFDAAICLYTTLGQMDARGDNIRLIQRVSNALKNKGVFIIEVPHREFLKNNYVAEERIGEGGRYADVQRHYDNQSHIMTETFRVVKGDSEEEFLLRYRVYRFEDLRYLLLDASFNVSGLYGGFDGSPLTDDSPVQVVVSKKDPSFDPYDALNDIR